MPGLGWLGNRLEMCCLLAIVLLLRRFSAAV